ncbi:hypothetical protein O3P69_000127 [Scylla paramamosain]|uniref:Uncharacterized protein n=1 Tax=Scylla paramamosain TaxID=85552 RepID=A0AAW0UUK5_SCYPA
MTQSVPDPAATLPVTCRPAPCSRHPVHTSSPRRAKHARFSPSCASFSSAPQSCPGSHKVAPKDTPSTVASLKEFVLPVVGLRRDYREEEPSRQGGKFGPDMQLLVRGLCYSSREELTRLFTEP